MREALWSLLNGAGFAVGRRFDIDPGALAEHLEVPCPVGRTGPVGATACNREEKADLTPPSVAAIRAS